MKTIKQETEERKTKAMILSMIGYLIIAASTVAILWKTNADMTPHNIVTVLWFEFVIFGIIFTIFVPDTDKKNEDFYLDEISKKTEEYMSRYVYCVKKHSIKLAHFTDISSDGRDFTLANKFLTLLISVDSFSIGSCVIDIFDKTKGEHHTITLATVNSEGRSAEEQCYYFFDTLCEFFNYETDMDKIFDFMNKENIVVKHKMLTEKIDIYLDINKAVEAELTVLPNITVAKAKQAIRLRKKDGNYRNLQQFYKRLNLDEEIVEQIPVKGASVILNKLPEYQKLEINKEE